MGRKTWFEAVLENGYDPTTQLQQIALFNKLVDKFEIILDSDPRNITLRGQEQPAGTEERTPSSKAAPGKPKARDSRLSEEDLGMVKELAGRGHLAHRQLGIHDPALPGINPLAKRRTSMKGTPQVIGRAAGSHHHRSIADASVSSRPARREAPGPGSGRWPEATSRAVRRPHEAPRQPPAVPRGRAARSSRSPPRRTTASATS